jgi:cell division protein FtsB
MMVKVSDAEERQAELKTLREENSGLKRQVAELGDAKKKSDALEEKASDDVLPLKRTQQYFCLQ